MKSLALATPLLLLAGALPLGVHTTATLARVTTCVSASAVAHRGGTERYVEDTRNAFNDTAANIGVHFWENDIRFTADNVPIIMHDTTVDRTTNGTGAVADLTWAQISSMHTADDQPVLTFADFNNDESVMHAYAFDELKTMPTEPQWTTFISIIKSREGKGGPKPAISSFDPDILDQIAVRLPGYTRALIQSTGDADPADITPHASILLKHHDSITTTRYAKWHNAGLRVYAWFDTANDDTPEWNRLDYVSGIITNYPQKYDTWTKTRTCLP